MKCHVLKQKPNFMKGKLENELRFPKHLKISRLNFIKILIFQDVYLNVKDKMSILELVEKKTVITSFIVSFT